MARRFFIGDIHGHYDGLRRLWDLMAPGADDKVYAVGDLIDRGPQSAQVVDFIRRYTHGCVRGNHEQLILDAFADGQLNLPTLQGWIYSGGQATLGSYVECPNVLDDHLAWIGQLPLYIDLGIYGWCMQGLIQFYPWRPKVAMNYVGFEKPSTVVSHRFSLTS